MSESRRLPVLTLELLVCLRSMCTPEQPAGPAGPCTGRADVRDLDDSSIPQDIKTALDYQPGAIIGRFVPERRNPTPTTPRAEWW